jgi:hypothetical protein
MFFYQPLLYSRLIDIFHIFNCNDAYLCPYFVRGNCKRLANRFLVTSKKEYKKIQLLDRTGEAFVFGSIKNNGGYKKGSV